MKTTHTAALLSAAAASALVLGTNWVRAAETGHYAPGLPSIRDFAVPEAGFYAIVYNYRYSTTRLNDGSGDEVDSVTIQPLGGPGVTLNLDVDVSSYVLAPALIWVSPWKIFGARYGAYILPVFADTSVAAALTTATGRGVGAGTSSFGIGDPFVQPIWLGWSPTHWDFALGYGFYAPIGRYDTEQVTLPVVGTIRTESPDNIGLGFWTHQFQGAATAYPWADKRMAILLALTYEINGDKLDFDLQPGQNLTLNSGISQYLPLVSDQSLLLELGVAGYDSWQITDDSGTDARNPSEHDQVHAIGGQLGLTYVPWSAALNVRYMHELASEDRFMGSSIGINLASKLPPSPPSKAQ
jgi:hypothetical protein